MERHHLEYSKTLMGEEVGLLRILKATLLSHKSLCLHAYSVACSTWTSSVTSKSVSSRPCSTCLTSASLPQTWRFTSSRFTWTQNVCLEREGEGHLMRRHWSVFIDFVNFHLFCQFFWTVLTHLKTKNLEVYLPKCIHKLQIFKETKHFCSFKSLSLNNPSHIWHAEASKPKWGVSISFNCSQCAVRRPAQGLSDLQAKELNPQPSHWQTAAWSSDLKPVTNFWGKSHKEPTSDFRILQEFFLD